MRLLCLGAEASGNRLLGRILVTAGDATREGRFAEWVYRIRLENGEELAMTMRSLPHGEDWPDVDALIEDFGPDKILFMWRDRTIQARSSFAGEHVGSLEEAFAEREQADQVLARIRGDVRVLVYELLVRDPHAQIANLGQWLGVTLRLPEPIYDGNVRHQ